MLGTETQDLGSVSVRTSVTVVRFGIEQRLCRARLLEN
jgi:hypothetical protein